MSAPAVQLIDFTNVRRRILVLHGDGKGSWARHGHATKTNSKRKEKGSRSSLFHLLQRHRRSQGVKSHEVEDSVSFHHPPDGQRYRLIVEPDDVSEAFRCNHQVLTVFLVFFQCVSPYDIVWNSSSFRSSKPVESAHPIPSIQPREQHTHSTPTDINCTNEPHQVKKKALNRSQLRAMERAICLRLYNQVKPAAAAFMSTPKNFVYLVFIVCLVYDILDIKKALNCSQLRAMGRAFCLKLYFSA